jgi:hypothetical protein
MQIHARSLHGSVLFVKLTNKKARLRNAKILCSHNAISTSLTPDTDSAAKGGVRVLGAGTSVPFSICAPPHSFKVKLWRSS